MEAVSFLFEINGDMIECHALVEMPHTRTLAEMQIKSLNHNSMSDRILVLKAF